MAFAFKCDRCGTVHTDVKEHNSPYCIEDGPRLHNWGLCNRCMCDFREFLGDNARKIVIGVDSFMPTPFKCDRCGNTHTTVHITIGDGDVGPTHTVWEICEDCIRAFKDFMGDGGRKIHIDDDAREVDIMNMSLLEPITIDNIHELQPGEWIWDNQDTERNKHEQSLTYNPIIEPYGFRQVHILNLDGFMRWQFKPFMLTTIHSGYGSSYTWTDWAEGRFYRFKREEQPVKRRKNAPRRAEEKWCEVDAVCRDCGETYKKRVNVSQKDFDNSSDIMKHFIKRGMCNQCRLKRNDSFRLRSDSIVANKKEDDKNVRYL